MKKSIVLLLTAILAVSSGCSKAAVNEINYSDTYVEGQDYQYSFCNKDTNYFVIQKCDGGYYFYLNSFLYYADEKSMNVIPLCNKSDCLHDKEANGQKILECNAYLCNNLLNSQFFYYNKQIYTMADESYYEGDKLIVKNSIYFADSDNTNKKKLFTIDYQIMNWFIHRGRLYYTTDYDDTVTAYDLSTNKAEAVLELASFGLFNTNLDNMFAYGNNLYFNVSGYKSEEEFNKMIEGESLDPLQYLYVLNISNGNNYTITSSSERMGIIFEGFEDDCVIFSDADYYSDNTEKKLYSADSDGNKTQLDFEYENLYDRYYTDDNFIYVQKAATTEELERNIFKVYDKSNKFIADIDFPDGFANSFYSGDENYLFYYEDSSEGVKLYYMSKDRLASGDTTLNVLYGE